MSEQFVWEPVGRDEEPLLLHGIGQEAWKNFGYVLPEDSTIRLCRRVPAPAIQWQPVKAIVPQPVGDTGGMSIVGIHHYDAAQWAELCANGEPEFALCVKAGADVPVEAIRTYVNAYGYDPTDFGGIIPEMQQAHQDIVNWLDQQQEDR